MGLGDQRYTPLSAIATFSACCILRLLLIHIFVKIPKKAALLNERDESSLEVLEVPALLVGGLLQGRVVLLVVEGVELIWYVRQQQL